MEACACSLCFHTWIYIGTHIKLPLALPLACPASIRSVSALGATAAGRCRAAAAAPRVLLVLWPCCHPDQLGATAALARPAHA